MKLKLLNKYLQNQSLIRLCLFVALVANLIFAGIAITIYEVVEDGVEQKVKEVASLNLDMASTIVENHLKSVEVPAYAFTSGWFDAVPKGTKEDPYTIFQFPAGQLPPSPADNERFLTQFLEACPHIWGIAIGFESDIAQYYGKDSYGIFVQHNGDYITSFDLTKKKTDFHDDNWYKNTKKEDRPRWSRPFRDVSGHIISAFCLPLHGADGRFIGVLAVDLQLDKFTDQLLSEIKPYEGSTLSVFDQDLTFIANKDHDLILNQTVAGLDAELRKNGFQTAESLATRMLNRQAGMDIVAEGSDLECMVFYVPLKSAHWTLALTCPSKAVYHDLYVMGNFMIALFMIGVLILVSLVSFLFFQIRKVVHVKSGIESELRIASKIQLSMIPKLFPPFPERKDMDCYATLKPAKSVGGDLFDFFIKKDEATGHDLFFFTIGDVSGKGVPASLLMAVTRSLFRNVSLHVNDPALVAEAINEGIAERNEYNMFCTMFIGVLDLVTGHLDFCNAGHNPGIFRPYGGRSSYLTVKPNLAVGLFSGFKYETESMDLSPKDSLYIYTDGVSEAEDVKQHLFGEDRTLEVVRRVEDAEPKVVVETMLQALDQYSEDAEQSDDITMLCVTWYGSSQL